MKDPDARTIAGDIAAIVLIRCAAEIAINPAGDFPLNDDWAWGRTVQTLLQTGGFHPTGWGPMSLLSHVLWGALFCLPAGFSFTALRLAGFAASLAAAAGCYLLIVEARGSRALAVVAALTWLFNPITFALSATFMTDVPFTAMAVFAALFFVRHLRTADDADLVIATLFSMAAILSRQLAISLPLFFAVALLALRGFRAGSFARAVLPAMACYTVLAIFEHWLIMSRTMPALYRPLTIGLLYALASPHGPSGNLALNSWLVTVYVGCTVLPVLLFVLPDVYSSLRSSGSRIAAATAGLGLLVVSVYLIATRRLSMPLSGNIVTANGIGPLTLRDTYIMFLPNIAPLPAPFWEMVTAISVVGVVLLAVTIVACLVRLWLAARARQFGVSHAAGFFFLACAVCNLAPIAEGFFDRYLVPSLPFVAAAICALLARQSTQSMTAGRLIVPLVLLGLFAGFSVAGTRDYLAWNRARWGLIDDVLAGNQATPRQVDGGFEFNGWHLYDASYVPMPDKSWWWVDRDEYVVTFGAIPGWDIVRERTFVRWLPPGEGRIALLTRRATRGE